MDGDRTTSVPVTLSAGEVVLTGGSVLEATGWEPKAHGMCRAEV